ncbi:MAG: Spy/CpxP family protein refolding chaperone [Colwellia sp.]
MKITFKTCAIVTSLCSALILAPVSYACSDNLASHSETHAKKHHHSGEARFAKLIKKLGLSDSQQAEIKTLKSEAKVENEALRPAMKAIHDQVKVLTSAESFDEQAFIALYASNQDVFTSRALIKAKSKFAMKNILTAEQLEIFNSMKDKKSKKHKKSRK